MSKPLVPEDVREILEDVLGLDQPIPGYSALTNASHVKEWSSLNNVRFLLRVEQEFGVDFPIDRVEKLANIGDLVQLINELRG
jgi:acyl carrier protein